MPKSRKRSISSQSINRRLLEEEYLKIPAMPPWYVRAFIYGLVIFCFIFVFTMDPNPERYHEDKNRAEGMAATINRDAPYQPKIVTYEESANSEGYACYQTETVPTFQQCIEDVLDEKTKQVENTRARVTSQFEHAIQMMTEGGVIDIGAGLGFFSLLAAAIGKSVVAVEPLAEHVDQFRTSIMRNEFAEKITLIQNAISNEYAKVPTVIHEKTVYVEAIVLDDLPGYTPFKKAVVRIGSKDCVALEKSQRFFEHIDVRMIFMDWNITKDENEKCLESMIDRLTKLSFQPFSTSDIELKSEKWKSGWNVKHVIWKRK